MTRKALPKLVLVAVAALAIAADDATQKVNVGGISFDAPKAWKASKPSSSMRLTQFKIDPAEGDTEPAELVLFAFKGGGGTVRANLERWQAQFVDKDGNPPEMATETRKSKSGDVTFAETSGRYVAAMTPGSPEKFDKGNWRLLGAIVQTPSTGYYFKMVGPDKTMKAAKPAVEALIKSIEVEKE